MITFSYSQYPFHSFLALLLFCFRCVTIVVMPFWAETICQFRPERWWAPSCLPPDCGSSSSTFSDTLWKPCCPTMDGFLNPTGKWAHQPNYGWYVCNLDSPRICAKILAYVLNPLTWWPSSSDVMFRVRAQMLFYRQTAEKYLRHKWYPFDQ